MFFSSIDDRIKKLENTKIDRMNDPAACSGSFIFSGITNPDRSKIFEALIKYVRLEVDDTLHLMDAITD